jgi:hypothetical protein
MDNCSPAASINDQAAINTTLAAAILPGNGPRGIEHNTLL